MIPKYVLPSRQILTLVGQKNINLIFFNKMKSRFEMPNQGNFGKPAMGKLTRSNGAKSKNNILPWLFAGAAVVGAITRAGSLIYRIRKDKRKREDEAEKEKQRQIEAEQRRREEEEKEKRKREEKEKDRKWKEQQDKERREFNAEQRQKEWQARAAERAQNQQFRLDMKRLGVQESTQPTICGSESLADLGTRDIPSPEELRLIGPVIHSGERGVIFGASGQGKSVLAWQIGVNLALGESCCLFPHVNAHHAPMQVHIFDGELSSVDVLGRYPKEFIQQLHNIKRVSCHAIGYKSLICQVKSVVNKIYDQECAIIVDNLFYICPGITAKQISGLYDAMKAIGEEASLRGTKVTMIIVVHNSKETGYDKQEISIDDMCGSSYIGNFANFAIGIAATADDDIKRIQVVKMRMEQSYKNVIIARKVSVPYVHMEYVNDLPKGQALAEYSGILRSASSAKDGITLEVAQQMWAMYKPGEKGYGYETIGKKFGVSGTAVRKAFKRHRLSKSA